VIRDVQLVDIVTRKRKKAFFAIDCEKLLLLGIHGGAPC
jgi:hypothetical protein